MGREEELGWRLE